MPRDDMIMLALRRTLATFCVPILVAACGPETVETPPADVTGRWTTDAPAYADRAFEITEDLLYLLQGGDTFSVYRIQEVEMPHGDLALYSIEYRGDENEIYSFRFYLTQEEGGTIFFPNQSDMKWHREPDADVPWALAVEAPGP